MDNDTICAPASAPVQSALALIRVSGSSALKYFSEIFSHPERLIHQKSTYGYIKNGSHKVDDVVAVYFKAPHSFTGEDTVEISCHGNPLIVQNILTLLMKNDSIRMADPGEFTKRAYLNGKIDLTAAQAVDSIIRARSEWEIESALNQMHGFLKHEIDRIKNLLILFKADIEATIDFSTEEIDFADRIQLKNEIIAITDEIEKLLKRCKIGERLSHGLNIAIVGKPNAGKSSLLNYIINEERAIVSEIPGTTRDIIRETIQISGIHINLIDTAGIRNSEDSIEKIGILRSKEAVNKAHLVLCVLDGEIGITHDDKEIFSILPKNNVIYVINKCDLQRHESIEEFMNSYEFSVLFSSVTGYGFSKLEETISSFLFKGIDDYQNSFIADRRVVTILENSVLISNEILSAIDNHISEDLIASDTSRLIENLQQITGEVSPDDVLNSIFSRFCIGK
jgi:tRNA modification GTPase